MSRQNQTTALKQRIMDAALARFSDVGVERTNVGDILEDVDCSVGSLYHHFGNKEGIAEALFISGVSRFNANLLDALLPSETAESGVKAIVIYLCQWVTTQPQLAAYLLSREIKLSEQARQELREMDDALTEALSGWFAPHIESGDLMDLPFSVYVPLISGATLEYSRMWLSRRINRPPENMSAVLAEAAWQSVSNKQR